jgi:uncharacterized protein YqgV (UPF0045/DUF77 family)
MYISLQEALIEFPEGREVIKEKLPAIKDEYINNSIQHRRLKQWAWNTKSDRVKVYLYDRVSFLETEMESIEKYVRNIVNVLNTANTPLRKPPEKLNVEGARNTPLFEVIQRHYPHIKVLKNNRKHLISCPFHNDKTPSMSIDKNLYYCFGCNIGGDTIKFVQELDKTDFKSAINKICG